MVSMIENATKDAAKARSLSTPPMTPRNRTRRYSRTPIPATLIGSALAASTIGTNDSHIRNGSSMSAVGRVGPPYREMLMVKVAKNRLQSETSTPQRWSMRGRAFHAIGMRSYRVLESKGRAIFVDPGSNHSALPDPIRFYGEIPAKGRMDRKGRVLRRHCCSRAMFPSVILAIGKTHASSFLKNSLPCGAISDLVNYRLSWLTIF